MTYQQTAKNKPQWHLLIAMGILALAFFVYLLSFTGLPKTDDERYIIDTTESISIHATLQLNQTAYLRQLQRTDVELAQPILSAPLYWLAFHLPWASQSQALFLFAPFVTALLAAVMYLYLRDLTYSHRTALISSLLLAFATMLWPYTKTFFREPLTTLMMFLGAFFWQRWRLASQAQSSVHIPYLIAACLVTILALLSKEAAFLVLPVYVALAFNFKGQSKDARRIFTWGGAILLLLLILFILVISLYREQSWALSTRYNFDQRLLSFLQGLRYAGPGILGFLFSPGVSIWVFSPILLLSLASPFLLPRNRWREGTLFLIFLIWFVIVYAAIRGEQWRGGTGWGPRYLLPVIPFLMVAAAPALDAVLTRKKAWLTGSLIILSAFSVIIQIVGSYTDIFSYEAYAINQTGQLPYSQFAIWNWRWSQAFGTLFFFPQAQTDIRWFLPTTDSLAIGLLLVFVALTVGLLVFLHRNRSPSRWQQNNLALGIILFITLGSAFTLWRAFDDPRLDYGNAALDAMNAFLSENATPDDVIFLSSPTYTKYMNNYFKSPVFTVSLPLSQGHIYNPDQPVPEHESTRDLLAPSSVVVLDSFTAGMVFNQANRHLWVVEDLSTFLPWAVRPVERYMSETYFPIQAIDFSDRVRVVQYLPFKQDALGQLVASDTDARFGEQIELSHYELTTRPYANDGILLAGEELGVSLYWTTASPISEDYTLVVFVIGPDGLPVLQRDTYPVGGFRPTSSWQPAEIIQDNHGFILPNDLPAGHYQVWSAMYSWPTIERLPITLDGQPIGDHFVLYEFTLP